MIFSLSSQSIPFNSQDKTNNRPDVVPIQSIPSWYIDYPIKRGLSRSVGLIPVGQEMREPIPVNIVTASHWDWPRSEALPSASSRDWRSTWFAFQWLILKSNERSALSPVFLFKNLKGNPMRNHCLRVPMNLPIYQRKLMIAPRRRFDWIVHTHWFVICNARRMFVCLHPGLGGSWWG